MMTRIGKYELGRKLGQGTFGTVKQGKDVEEGTQWALKIIPKSALEETPALKTRLSYEVRILQLLDHPNVMPLREVLSTPHYYCLVFPLATDDLFDRVAQARRFPERVARHYFTQLIAGVRYLHEHRVVHRDLKPENLLLDRRGQLRIADFGLATVMKLDPETSKIQLLTDFCGTRSYLAPEVERREPYDGRAADMWACGAILYVMLSGRTLQRQDPEEVRRGLEGVSPAGVSLVEQLLQPDVSRRLTADAAAQHAWMRPLEPPRSPLTLYPSFDVPDPSH